MRETYEICDRGAKNLCSAILLRAAKDSIRLRRRKNAPGENTLTEPEKFLLSDWGQWISGGRGEYILQRCRCIARKRRSGRG